jgi:4-hydroxybenzoate polyprenyltransferase
MQLRPIQWTKNGLLFAALIFTIPRVTFAMFGSAAVGFFLFSLVSGCVYILNDLVDLEADRNNPDKWHRPMASGLLKPAYAIGVGFGVWVISLWLAWRLNELFFGVLLCYFCLNVLYSLYLKRIALVDVLTIAAGFVMRAAAGGMAIGVRLTPWFLCCALILSLFLAVGKRRYEFVAWKARRREGRQVLQHYSLPLLNLLSTILAGALIVTYILFTCSPTHTRYLTLTIPFVGFGVLRYYHLVHLKQLGGRPEILLLKDKPVLVTVSLFVISVITILYLFN